MIYFSKNLFLTNILFYDLIRFLFFSIFGIFIIWKSGALLYIFKKKKKFLFFCLCPPFFLVHIIVRNFSFYINSMKRVAHIWYPKVDFASLLVPPRAHNMDAGGYHHIAYTLESRAWPHSEESIINPKRNASCPNLRKVTP